MKLSIVINLFILSANALPNIDWRTKGFVTPVKNQDRGQCKSGYAFAAIAALEGAHFSKTGKLVSLSEQQIIDCSGLNGNQGCENGSIDESYEYIKANGGIDTEESYPYTAQDGVCKFNQNTIGEIVSGYVDIATGNEKDLQKYIATVGPISVMVDSSNPSFESYIGGIYDEPECSSDLVDHGMTVVGMGTDENGKDYYLVKNSWGTQWGEDGYIRMSANKNNQCGIATQASYPIP